MGKISPLKFTLDDYESTDWVDEWDHVSLVVEPHVVVETVQSEEGQSFISTYYDNISYLYKI